MICPLDKEPFLLDFKKTRKILKKLNKSKELIQRHTFNFWLFTMSVLKDSFEEALYHGDTSRVDEIVSESGFNPNGKDVDGVYYFTSIVHCLDIRSDKWFADYCMSLIARMKAKGGNKTEAAIKVAKSNKAHHELAYKKFKDQTNIDHDMYECIISAYERAIEELEK